MHCMLHMSKNQELDCDQRSLVMRFLPAKAALEKQTLEDCSVVHASRSDRTAGKRSLTDVCAFCCCYAIQRTFVQTHVLWELCDVPRSAVVNTTRLTAQALNKSLL
jgi:hypothetical protein